jgi:hypothetical protein
MAMVGETQTVVAPVRRRRRPAISKPPLFTRDCLDGRTVVGKAFDQLVRDIRSDLGGEGELSRIEISLIEAYASAALLLDQLNAQLLQGQPIDLPQFAQCSTTMVRIASRLGLRRRAKEVLTLDQYIQERERAAVSAEADEAEVGNG